MTEAFVRNIDQFVNDEGVDLVAFKKGQRKDDVTQKYVRKFTQREGVLYVGKARRGAVSARSGAAVGSQAEPIRGSWNPPRWSTTTISIASMKTSAVLPEVLLLLSLQCQALHQRQRVSQAPACQAGGGVRGAGQRRQVLCQPQADAAVVRRAVGGQDRFDFCANGCDACRIRFRHAIAPPVIVYQLSHPAGRVLASPRCSTSR